MTEIPLGGLNSQSSMSQACVRWASSLQCNLMVASTARAFPFMVYGVNVCDKFSACGLLLEPLPESPTCCPEG